MFGRDPWKADEPYSVGMVLNFFRGHDLIVPRVAADPFVEKPPLMYWSGALLARASSSVLSVFQGAQLAVLAWVLLAIALVGRLSRRLNHRPAFDWLAPVLMIGSLGAIENVHKLTADVPQMAGAAIALSALARLARNERHPNWSGVFLGTGVGIAFLSKGLLVPGVLALTCLAALLVPAYRNRRYAMALVWAGLASLPWLIVWPLLFWQASHALFVEWFWNNNFGRFFGFVHLGGERKSYWSDLGNLIALTFPASWLALGALVASLRVEGWRRYLAARPEQTVLWIYVALFVGTLVASSVNRDVYALPIFPALAVLGAGGILSRRVEKISTAIVMGVMSVLGLFLWVRWGLRLTGHGHVAAGPIGKWLPLDYPLAFSMGEWLAAVVLLALWVMAIVRRRELGALMLGFAGLTFVWGTLSTLLLPWINEARSYRTPFVQMREALPPEDRGNTPGSCVASFFVGESERAMLDYFIDVRPVQIAELDDPTRCNALLMLDKANKRFVAPTGWREVWEGGRAGDDNERFRLLVRAQ